MAEEGGEEEVELLLGGDAVEARVAEADGFSFSVGRKRDLGGNGEREAEAGTVDGRSESGVSFDADDDAVLVEGEFRIFGIGKAGGLG